MSSGLNSQIQELIAKLGNSDPIVRSTAASALGRIAQRNSKLQEIFQAIQSLTQALKDPYEKARLNAALALARIAKKNPSSQELFQAIPLLVQTLNDPNEEVRSSVVRVFVYVGLPTILSLAKSLNDPEWQIRANAALAIGEIALNNPNSKAIIPAIQPLIKALNDPDKNVRTGAAIAFEQIGLPALKLLIKALNDPDNHVQSRIIPLLNRIVDATANLKPSQQLALEIKGILSSKELIQLASIDRKLYSQLFTTCNKKLRECQVKMDGVQVEPPKRFIKNVQQGTIRLGGKSHV